MARFDSYRNLLKNFKKEIEGVYSKQSDEIEYVNKNYKPEAAGNAVKNVKAEYAPSFSAIRKNYLNKLNDVTEALKTLLETQIEDMGIGELLGLGLETMLVSLCLKIISVLITVILYGRMIEIYLYVSVAPIPFSTFTNREWGSIGNNYVKALLALGFQGFFMMVCVAIYAVLVNAITVADNLHTAIWSVAAYTVILCFSLFKTSSLAKSIFNAH